MGYSIGIVGGGAAGMMAAIAAAGQGAEVTLLEGNDRPGKKLLSTGNGKCNLGNERLTPDAYYTGCPALLESCLKRFGTEDTKAFFRELGLMTKSRNGGLYPVSEQASTVLDVLRYGVREAGVELVTDCRVESIRTGKTGKRSGRDAIPDKTENVRGEKREIRDKKGMFQVVGNGKTFRFDRIILACGGKAAPKTGSDGSGYRLAGQLGHGLVPVVPALVQLKCREDYFKSVAGVRAEAEIKIFHKGKCMARERGELLLTDYGISGIPVFQISRVANYIIRDCVPEVETVIDFLPDDSPEELENFVKAGKFRGDGRTAEEFFTGLLNKKLMLLFIRLSGLKPGEKITGANQGKIRRVLAMCKNWCVHVNGSNPFDNAQVCAGGVPLEEVTQELESRLAPGVYFAGEILDVDGKCGGYNLQWAWSSGYIAGVAAAGKRRAETEDAAVLEMGM